ncbi:DUF1620-domain-containing protein [Gyrodon lividus]|nr:DUF1620-domain-containing protein [Gyrodon lividus]
MSGIRLLWSLLSFSLFTLCARALHESEVGIIDWHTKLIGVPLYNSQLTAPVFHNDLVLTATSNNVFAALNATDGSIVWRSMYDAEDPILGFRIHDDSVSSLSGPGGSTLRTYDISTGHLLLEKRLHNPIDGRPHEPPSLGIGLAYLGAQDADQPLVLLTNGDTVTRVNTKTGEFLWEWRSPDQGSLVMYTHIYPDLPTSTLYLAGFAKSVRSYTLHVTTLDLTTGELVASVHVPADVASALADFLLVGPSATSASTTGTHSDASADKTASIDETGPCLIWLSPSSPSSPSSLSLFSAPLSPSLKGRVLTIPNASYERILDVGLAGNGLFMAFRDNGAGEVMGYGFEARGAGVRVVWDFGDVAPSKVNSESRFIGVLDERGGPRIGRVFWSNARNQAIHQTFEAHLEEGKGSVTGFAFPFETREHGVVKHVAFFPSTSASSNDTAHKVLLTTSTGSLQLWAHDALQWVREESLASVQVAAFLELPPARQDVTGGAGGKGGQGFWGKVGRQVGDVKNLPQYLFHFITRFVTGSYASPSSPVSLSSPSSIQSTIPRSIPSQSPTSTMTTLVRDPFSFRQLLIASTAQGKLFALDTSTGAIVWSRILGLGWARKVGGLIVPVRIFIIRGRDVASGESGMVGDLGVDGKEEAVLVAQRMADNGLVDTVVFHFDPLTGEDIKIVISTDSDRVDTHVDKETEYANAHANVKDSNGQWVTALEAVDVIAGPLIEVFLLPDEKGTVGLLDEFLQVQLYPDTPATRASLTTLAPNLYIALRAGTQILGHQLGLNDELSSFHVAFSTWGVSFDGGEEVVEIIRSAHKGGQVASMGKVKGDRSTLYKYLNPHLSVVLTASPSSPSSTRKGTCRVYILDTVKGTVVYHASLPAAEGKCDVRAALEENWLVYSYYDGEVGLGGAKSYRVVSVEMYEGYQADDKIRSSDITSYSNKTTDFSVYEQAFVVPYGITAIAPTMTKFGVSTKDMIVASRKNSIHALPRRLLDPRRPRRKPTNEEAEEMLVQYDAVLPDDPRLTLSHYYEVADVRQILTAPSLLESTSLILAIGTDLFLTRIATSGTFDVLSENFNKVQLVFTVVGLAVAIAVTKPMVRRKKLRERWY